MRVNERFYSIQGEGVLAGIPTVFIRLQGCNLRCKWCDTVRAQDESGGEELPIGVIIAYVKDTQPLYRQWVCITGGEPLLHPDIHRLVHGLKREGFRISIETNGSYPPPPWHNIVDSWVADCKCPSSGHSDTFRLEWTDLTRHDQIKFVVADREDLDFVVGMLSTKLFVPQVLISPVAGILVDRLRGTTEEYWNNDWLKEVAEFCKEHRLRMSLQLHKLIWGSKAGV